MRYLTVDGIKLCAIAKKGGVVISIKESATDLSYTIEIRKKDGSVQHYSYPYEDLAVRIWNGFHSNDFDVYAFIKFIAEGGFLRVVAVS